jgi:hypothetical protein
MPSVENVLYPRATQTLADAFHKVRPSEWMYMLTPLLGMVATIMFFLMALNAKRARCWTPFWLVLSGVIHSYLEMAFTFFRTNPYFGGAMDLYSAADFRYGFPMEEGTAAMETITCVPSSSSLFIAFFLICFRIRFKSVVFYVLMNHLYVCSAFLDGPLCLLAAYAFVTQRHYYHPLVMTV